ncbi:MAG: hypothetical protein KF912_12905 [Phycisphaeraceae bacterium]|nr:hypothetical protein [Phycisphaeraceae bacterium]MBX3368204.1 hypothetical protein [Phycisphaeraceae bacterium]
MTRAAQPLPHPPVASRPAGARASRVLWLVGLTVTVAFADLYMTLIHATSVGLHEANPLARALMLYNCPWVVVAFRSLTIILFALVLIRARTRPSAEIAAWTCALVMVWLLFRWDEYNSNAQELTTALALIDEHNLTDFVSIGPRDK